MVLVPPVSTNPWNSEARCWTYAACVGKHFHLRSYCELKEAKYTHKYRVTWLNVQRAELCGDLLGCLKFKTKIFIALSHDRLLIRGIAHSFVLYGSIID